ncbi:hypothetical protein CEXT_349561 [Caerostris extrusa]|uniref:Uncharacterized protein n=1 Tax=Caerostris extrusa TaxID=172846 RepID=A0AAV4VCG2_CAEEX|nr:hypothetical protein CEXT_349561 [Caerostris extrusa]
MPEIQFSQAVVCGPMTANSSQDIHSISFRQPLRLGPIRRTDPSASQNGGYLEPGFKRAPFNALPSMVCGPMAANSSQDIHSISLRQPCDLSPIQQTDPSVSHNGGHSEPGF